MMAIIKRISNTFYHALFLIFSIAVPFLVSLSPAFAGGEGFLPEITGEGVPYDRPVEEIEPYLLPMNELTLFPCSDCHDKDWETNHERRQLDEPHNEIPGRLDHGPANWRWCLECHDAMDRDKLRLVDGSTIEFRQYYKLCAQCHPKIYRQWKMGLHNKVLGNWKGEKRYWHCTMCHNPHDPPFKPQKPSPPPVRPEEMKRLYDELVKRSTEE